MKIGILAGKSLSEFNHKMLKPIISHKEFSVKLVVVDNRPQKTLREKFMKNLKRGRGGYIIVMGLQRLFSSDKSKSEKTESFFSKLRIPILKTVEPYSKHTVAKIKSYNLDVLLLIGGFGIVNEPLLSLTPYGILSYHHGNMRKYRGMPPAFWELYNAEKEMGVTVQKLSESLDSGLPIVENTVKILSNDNLKKLTIRAYKESEDMMYKALITLNEGKVKPKPLSNIGKIYTLPNFRQWILLNSKIACRKITLVFK